MVEPQTAAELARLLGDVLERHGLPYAIGGAIALGFYAPPRATMDVDVNVFVPPQTDLARLLDTLSAAGFVPADDAASLRTQACTEGQFQGAIAGMRVDVFVPAIPFYAQLEARRQQVPLLGRPIWIVGAEDLVVLKLMFFRRKDLADVEAVLREQATSLDRAYIRQTLVELAGPADERVAALETIERELDLAE